MMLVSGMDQRHVRSSLKRSACDRCRNQKLRCLRDASDATACRRCTRAGARCATSAPKPPGRPVRSTPPAEHSSPARAATAEMAEQLHRGGVEVMTGRGPSMGGGYVPATLDSHTHAGADSTPTTLPRSPHHLTSAAGCTAPLDIDDADMLPLDWMLAGGADFPQLAFSQSELGHAPNLPEDPLTSDVFHRQGPFDWLETSWHLSGSSRSIQPTSAEVDEAARPSSSPPPYARDQPTSDAGLQLCRINLTLSKQLSFFTTRSWEDVLTTITCPGGTRSTPAQPSQQPAQPNPLGDLLRNTSDFLSILYQFSPASAAPPHNIGHASRPRRQSSPPPRRRSPWPPDRVTSEATNTLGSPFTPPSSSATPAPRTLTPIPIPTNTTPELTTAMSLLSTYLHLVAIYEALFRHLVVSLSHIPASSVSSLQTVPDLRLAGFSVQHGGLQIKMLIQVVEHHFETIDGVLGLPVRYRVFGGGMRARRDHDRGGGLLGGREFEALLEAVLGSIGTGPAVGPGFRNILSLRQGIEKVQRYL